LELLAERSKLNLEQLVLNKVVVPRLNVGLIAGFPHLRVLECFGMEYLGTDALERFADALPCLQVLTMSRCGISDYGLEPLARLSLLSSLNFSDNNDLVTGEGFQHLRTLPTLIFLNLNFCGGLRDAALAELALLPLRVHLQISWCLNLRPGVSAQLVVDRSMKRMLQAKKRE
jgi:hypothetical protein